MVLLGRVEDFAQPNQFGPVHAQGLDSCSAHRSQADYHRRIRRPGEVVLPQLSSRVKQSRRLSRKRVGGVLFSIFMAVESLTRKRQIIVGSGATGRTRDDVLDRKWLRREARLTAAIFANTSSAKVKELPQLFDAS